MKHLPGILFLITAGCGNFELPPAEVGSGGGARLMTGTGRTPAESYEIAYAQLTKQHLNVRRNLTPPANEYGASLSMQSILDAFATMRALVTPACQSKFDPEISLYRDWKERIDRHTWGGSFLQDFDWAERRVKEAFKVGNMDLVSDFPGQTAKEASPKPPPPATPPREVSPAIPDDKVVPPGGAPAATESPAAKPAEKGPDSPAPAAGGRLYFKAWQQSHEDLITGYKTNPRPDLRTKYDDVIESLRLLKATFSGDRAQNLQVYMNYYGGINEKTKGFTALPEKTTEADVLNDLKVISEVIRKEFNPDK